MSNLSVLYDHLARATGPDPKIDGLIVGAFKMFGEFNIYGPNRYAWCLPNWRYVFTDGSFPAFTESFDLAVTLVPTGWFVQTFGQDGVGTASCLSHFVTSAVARNMRRRGEKIHYVGGRHGSLALSMCEAAVKAHLALEAA